MQSRFDEDGSVLVRLSRDDSQYDVFRQQLLERGNGTVAKYAREAIEDEALELAQSYADNFNALEKAGVEIDAAPLSASVSVPSTLAGNVVSCQTSRSSR